MSITVPTQARKQLGTLVAVVEARFLREAQVTGRSAVAPLLRCSVPLPFGRLPSHTVFAVRSAIAMSDAPSVG